MVVERDNRSGDFAELKTLLRFEARQLWRGISAEEKRVYDLLPQLRATPGWITDKPEGVAVTDGGQLYAARDSDGVDGWSGETFFLRLGRLSRQRAMRR